MSPRISKATTRRNSKSAQDDSRRREIRLPGPAETKGRSQTSRRDPFGLFVARPLEIPEREADASSSLRQEMSVDEGSPTRTDETQNPKTGNREILEDGEKELGAE